MVRRAHCQLAWVLAALMLQPLAARGVEPAPATPATEPFPGSAVVRPDLDGGAGKALLRAVPEETLKGGTIAGPAETWPKGPPSRVVPAVAAPPPIPCEPQLVARPLVIGKRDHFAKLGGLAKGFAMGALSKALSTATGGAAKVGGKKGEKPDLYRDQIAKRHKVKVEHPDGRTRLRIGGELFADGLMLSTRLDKARDKGTFHAIYLEDEGSCERIWPFAHYAYEFWGEWKLSVSWTRTTETYQDGNLIDRDVDTGGFTSEWSELLASGSGVLDLAEFSQIEDLDRYQAALRDEMGEPVWRSLGFGAPTSGARSVGTPFKLEPEQLQALLDGQMRAVVHVTREGDGVFQTVALPMRVNPGKRSRLLFEPLAGAFD